MGYRKYTHKKRIKSTRKKNYFCKSLLSSVSFDLILSLSYFLPGDYSVLNCLLGMYKWKRGKSGKEEKNNALTHGVKAIHG